MKRLLAVLLLITLTPPASASAADRPSPAGPSTTVTLITGDRVMLRAGRVAIESKRSGVSFQTTRIGGAIRVVPSDVAHLIGKRLDPQLFDISVLARYGDGAVPVITNGRARATLSNRLLHEDVWLDAPVRADRIDQTPGNIEQIEAPAAWPGGLTGQGVRVAVLDTGIDATHPDLAGRVAESANFTDSPTVADLYGHGTHVASIAAGRRGVAPGATLLSAKVLGDDGTGTLSDVIEGIEWAVTRGAQVVNLSLSSDTPSTGQDPLSRAVNELSKAGTLFIASAGNRGPGASTVGAPGAADEALTVGAVDSRDRLADFSSRGPRTGDYAIKPDIVAPGVDIVGARARDTALGRPLGRHYTRLSGTSMAAPHVAGGAALLAQHRPQWTGAMLKSALMGTADQVGAVFDTGAGRLDLARVIDQTIIAQRPAIGLGFVPYPPTGIRQQELTLRNTGQTTVTVDLRTETVTAAPARLTIPAGASATAVVSADVTQNGGAVRAGGLRVPVGWFKEPAKHLLHIRANDRLGSSKVETLATVINLREISAGPPDPVLLVDGAATVRVPPGFYAVTAAVPTVEEGIPDPDDDPVVTSVSIVTVAETAVFADTEVVLDARTAKPVSATVEGEETTPVDVQMFVAATDRDDDQFALGYATSAQDVIEGKLFVSPTRAPRNGRLELSSKWRLNGVSSTYDLLFAGPSFPDSPAYSARRRDLTAVSTTYRTAGPRLDFSDGRFAYTEINPVSVAIFQGVPPAPTHRHEYVTTDRSWHWHQCVNLATPEGEGVGSYCQPELTRTHSWLTAPLRTRVGVFRTPTQLQFGMDDLADGPNTGSLSGHTLDHRAYALYRNGIRIAEGTEAFGSVTVPKGPATFRLDRVVQPRPGLLAISSRVESSWTFTDPESLVDIAISAPVDERNTLPSGVPIRLDINVDGGRLDSLELSFDDGRTWTVVTGRTVTLPPGAVSLRAAASGRHASHATQTVLRAFLVR
ncbi:S8 family peptidase [Allorhizocola rhizosphaerae]|uniref:S8 family peptidase n=1 Tax=Allorhizocola rhizosphaerae TaxID=1872709 RepID=UPI000E3D49F1|nr:S8 family peptidase [Allorhizocola rhizosphaerae]